MSDFENLREENRLLRKAVLNQCGDNLCWVVTPETARALPESEFLESCRRYRQQISDARGEYSGGMTIAQLEAANAQLRLEVDQERSEHAAAVELVKTWIKRFREEEQRADIAEAALEELRMAAEPFVRWLENVEAVDQAESRFRDKATACIVFGTERVTFGDFRKLAAALRGPEVGNAE